MGDEGAANTDINRWSIKDAPDEQHDIEEVHGQSEDMVNVETEEALDESPQLLQSYL